MFWLWRWFWELFLFGEGDLGFMFQERGDWVVDTLYELSND